MFVDYLFAHSPELPPLPDGVLYQYVVGQNGVFVRAERPGLSALIWSSAFYEPLRGLALVKPYVRLVEPVYASLLEDMLEWSRRAEPNEILFYLKYQQLAFVRPWQMVVPNQVGSLAGVYPLDPFNPSAKDALVEVHSHVHMDAFFSNTDDRDETGFRLYAVLGRIFDRPVINVRIGIYGHFWNIPVDWVFELPSGVLDALSIEAITEVSKELEYVDSAIDEPA